MGTRPAVPSKNSRTRPSICPARSLCQHAWHVRPGCQTQGRRQNDVRNGRRRSGHASGAHRRVRQRLAKERAEDVSQSQNQLRALQRFSFPDSFPGSVCTPPAQARLLTKGHRVAARMQNSSTSTLCVAHTSNPFQHSLSSSRYVFTRASSANSAFRPCNREQRTHTHAHARACAGQRQWIRRRVEQMGAVLGARGDKTWVDLQLLQVGGLTQVPNHAGVSFD